MATACQGLPRPLPSASEHMQGQTMDITRTIGPGTGKPAPDPIATTGPDPLTNAARTDGHLVNCGAVQESGE